MTTGNGTNGRYLCELLQYWRERYDWRSHERQMNALPHFRQLKVPTNRITHILNGQRSITGDTALRLGHFSVRVPSSG